MRKPWIQTIHGMGCLKHTSVLDLRFAQAIHELDKLCLICGSHNYSIHVCITFVAGNAWLDCTVISQHTCIGTIKEEPTEIKRGHYQFILLLITIVILIIKLVCMKVCAKFWTQIEDVTFVAILKLCCTWIANHDGATVYTSLNEPTSFRLYIFQLSYLRKSGLMILQW